jgi:hypothetical protein
MQTLHRRGFLTAAAAAVGGLSLSGLACAPHAEAVSGKVTSAHEDRGGAPIGDPVVPVSVYVLKLSTQPGEEFRVFASEFKGRDPQTLEGQDVTLEKRMGFWRVDSSSEPK